MDLQPLVELVTQTGIWCVSAFIIAKHFFEYIKKDGENKREDMKEDKDRMYEILDKYSVLMEQQKELLSEQVCISENNKEMLNRLTDIQMLHTNRLDRIEDRLGRLEEKAERE